MALCAVYAMLGDFAIGADCGVCLHRCDRKLYDTELCEFLYQVGGNKHLYLFVGYCADYHYHLTVRTDDGDDIFVDTNDVWDDGDRVGIRVAPSYIRLYKKEVKGRPEGL